jgi:two-component system, cell cycle sensor histidine kinase and response regulator CckA
MSDRLAWLEAELDRVTAERDALALALERAAPFEAAIGSAPVAIACVAGEKGRYLFVNAEYGRLVGKSPEELMVSDAYEIWVQSSRSEDFAIEHEAVGRLAKGEIDGYQLDRPYIVPGREPSWVRSTAVGFRDADGRLTNITVYAREIGEERAAALASERTAAQLQQAQKMDALGKLAGGVAHDFNNRLLIILGYTEMIKRELSPDSPLIHHADMVLTSAQRSADLTRQLLAYSRHQVLKPESFDVNQSVERMRQLLAKLIGDRVQLSTQLEAKNPVFSDPGQLEQVILNLAINARDAMPQGGRLTLATGDRAISGGEDAALPAGDYVTLTITDTGAGIPDDVLPHIFEPFFTTKPVGQGTGLGLSMAEGIVQQSRGAIRVASRVGEGTTFTIHLPRGPGVPDRQLYTAVAGTPRGAPFETVLVCDDDDDVRRLLVEILRLRAYTILEARTGKHALEIAAGHPDPIHLLVTDLVMPEMGGIDLAAQMRRSNPALRVLFVSGYTDRADVLSGPIRSHARFLAKPFAPGELTRAVHALLENEPAD